MVTRIQFLPNCGHVTSSGCCSIRGMLSQTRKALKTAVGSTLPVFIKQQLYRHIHDPSCVFGPVNLTESPATDLHETLQTVVTKYFRSAAELTGIHR